MRKTVSKNKRIPVCLLVSEEAIQWAAANGNFSETMSFNSEYASDFLKAEARTHLNHDLSFEVVDGVVICSAST